MFLTQSEFGFEAQGDEVEFHCCKCGRILQKKETGFKCAKDHVFCELCQDKWNKTNIRDEVFCYLEQLKNSGEHEHTRFTRK